MVNVEEKNKNDNLILFLLVAIRKFAEILFLLMVLEDIYLLWNQAQRTRGLPMA
jgi:hypothetical protein